MTRDRFAGSASILLGLGIAANALLGPLVFGVIRIRESTNMENQLLGGELTSLLLAAPLAIAGGVLWWRGNRLAPVLAVGPAGFAVYTYVQFVLVPDYSRYSGNSERFFPLYLALVLVGWTLVVRAWHTLPSSKLSPLPRSLARVLGFLMVVLNAAFALAWIGTIAAAWTKPPTAEYSEHPTAFWLIRLMDLGFVIPLGLATGAGLLKDLKWASRAAYAFSGTQTLLLCAVAGMAVRMWVHNDPAVTPALLAISVGGAASFVILYSLTLLSHAKQSPAPQFQLEASSSVPGHVGLQESRRG